MWKRNNCRSGGDSDRSSGGNDDSGADSYSGTDGDSEADRHPEADCNTGTDADSVATVRAVVCGFYGWKF
jgi:hypothetical protein